MGTHLQHVVAPTDEIQESIQVGVTEIAGAIPLWCETLGRFLRRIPVSTRDVGTSRDQFTLLERCRRLTIVLDDDDLGVRNGRADRTELALKCGWRKIRQPRRCFRRTIHDVEGRLQTALEPFE